MPRSATGRFSTPRGLTPVTPSQVLMEAQGILGEPFPRTNAVNSLILTSGVVYAMAIGLWENDNVQGIAANITVVGAGQTNVELGLYDRALNRLGTTGDVKATYATAAVNVVNTLTAPVTVPKTDAYYLAILGVGGTQPTLTRSSSSAANGGALPGIGGLQAYGTMAAQTSLPATLTLVTTSAAAFWLAAV